MGKFSANYQGELLNEARKENIPVTVFLLSGFQIKGTVKAFDNYVVLLESDGKQQMVYKHAISTIAPAKQVKINYNQIPRENDDGEKDDK